MPKRSTLRLTKRSVDALEPGRKDAIFWDRDLAGFGVRVHATGRKLCIVQSRGPAGLKQATLGPVGERTVEEYRREAAAAIDRIKRGEDPIPPEPEPTVADLAVLCLKDHVAARCKPATAENYRKSIDGHILPALGSKALKDVVLEDAANLHHALRGTPAAANQAIWVLSKMFSLAESWEMVPPGRNPCRHIRHYRATPRERFLTPDEFRRVGDALKAFEARGSMLPSAIAAIRLLMLTGCRKGEVLTLRWTDVDLNAGELHLPDAKSGPRAVQLPPPAVWLLENLPRREGNPFVFPGRIADGHYSAGALDHAWLAVRKAAKLEDVRIHDLRHSFASRALALGETLPVIGKLLGHNDIETTARYAHLAQDSVHEAAERIASSIAMDVL
ncbi:MAG: tyrosine-type recombinase/integrase [Alphaproteobacteria bacterium]|nr:tyrosine-type recombinase/integrase [Alphaproteobacteria bacterium]